MPAALVTIVESKAFSRRVAALLSANERDRLIEFLAGNPLAGDVVEGTGGVRKVRFAAQGKGKSGGVRVIYYFYNRDLPLYALLVYGKGERGDLSPDQRMAVSDFAAQVKASRKRRT